MRLTEILEIKHSFQSQYKFKFFIKKESSIRNVHVLKNAQMTRTNKRIKQGNTRKIKKIKQNNNNTTIVPVGVIPKYL